MHKENKQIMIYEPTTAPTLISCLNFHIKINLCPTVFHPSALNNSLDFFVYLKNRIKFQTQFGLLLLSNLK